MQRDMSARLKHITAIVIRGCLGVGMAACGNSGPADSELTAGIQAAIPPHWRIERVQRLAVSRSGSEADPIIEVRFKATASLLEPTFTLLPWPDHVPLRNKYEALLVEETGHQGATADLYGLATARPFKDSWATQVRLDEDPLAAYGRRKASFLNIQHFLVHRTAQYEAFVANRRQEIDERIAADRALVVRAFNDGLLAGEIAGGMISAPFVIVTSMLRPDIESASAQLEFTNHDDRRPLYSFRAHLGATRVLPWEDLGTSTEIRFDNWSEIRSTYWGVSWMFKVFTEPPWHVQIQARNGRLILEGSAVGVPVIGSGRQTYKITSDWISP